MSLSPSRDDFAALLDESLGGRDFMEGTVVKGQVVGVEKDFAIIDVGLKTEGRVLMKEFTQDDGTLTLKVGDTVEVFLERVENAMGEAVISRDKARREEAWTRLEGVYALNEPVERVAKKKTPDPDLADLDDDDLDDDDEDEAVPFLEEEEEDFDDSDIVGIPEPDED